MIAALVLSFALACMSHTQATQTILARQSNPRVYPVLAAVALAVAIAALLGGRPTPALATVCRDGWVSGSSGSGTCSHHGGVYSWG
jgi:hypothetical protein